MFRIVSKDNCQPRLTRRDRRYPGAVERRQPTEQRLIRGVELLVQVENEIERSGRNRDERAPLRHGVDSLALHVKALQQVTGD